MAAYNLPRRLRSKGSIYLADQKVKISRPRLRDIETGEVDLKSYKARREHGQFSEEILSKIMCGISAQKYEETVRDTASTFGVSSSSTAKKLHAFQTRPQVLLC